MLAFAHPVVYKDGGFKFWSEHRQRERLSEAATKLGSQADELAPGLPWPAVRAFGNVLRHAYDEVDPTRIWGIAINDLPRMAPAVEGALRRLDEAEQS